MMIKDPTCKAEAATLACQEEVTKMLGLVFKEQPMKKTNPYNLIGKLEVKLLEIKQAVAARESAKVKRLIHETNVIVARANIESIDLETGDLL